VKYLILSGNQLTGVIPANLTNLAQLVFLSLQENQLERFESSTLSGLRSLNKILLNQNLFEELPDFHPLQPIHSVFVNANRLKSLPKSLFEVESVKTLFCGQNPELKLGSEVFNLKYLTHLSFEQGTFENDFFQKMSMSNLEEISLESCGLEEFPKALLSISSLSIITLSGNRIPEVPQELNNLSNLVGFFCENCQMRTFPVLSNLKKFSYLDLSFNPLDQVNMSGSLPRLLDLEVSTEMIIPESLEHLSSLEYLTVMGSKNIPMFPPSLRFLRIRSSFASSWPPRMYNSSLPALKYFSIDQVAPIDFPPFLLNSPSSYLSTIFLGGNLQGSLPNSLFDLPNLTYLFIQSTSIEGSFSPQIGKLSKLTTLGLLSNSKLRGELSDQLLSLPLDDLLIQNNNLDSQLSEDLTNLNVSYCSLSNGNTHPFTCIVASENFTRDTICNVECSGNVFRGIWMNQDNSCKIGTPVDGLESSKSQRYHPFLKWWTKVKWEIGSRGELSEVKAFYPSDDCGGDPIYIWKRGRFTVREVSRREGEGYEVELTFKINSTSIQTANSTFATFLLKTCNITPSPDFVLINNCSTLFPGTDAVIRTTVDIDFRNSTLLLHPNLFPSLEPLSRSPALESRVELRRNWDCGPDPRTMDCIPLCGDGVVLKGEQCDDGNIFNGDGCSSNCTTEQTHEYHNDNSKTFIEVGTLVGGVGLLLIVFSVCYVRKSGEKNFSIEDKDLELREVLGEGRFGLVYKGMWRGNTEVAVKVLKHENLDANEEKQFKKEAFLLKELSPHPNIVQFLGLSITSSSTSSPIKEENQERKGSKLQLNKFSIKIVTEFIGEGSLHQFMRTHFRFQSLNEYPLNLSYTHIIELAKGITAGMDHLHKNKIVHRDLAARNILIQTSNRPQQTSSMELVKMTVKISDFGLSVQSKRNIHIPIRWAAPEVLRNPFHASQQSDVWAFGITLFELCVACAEIPYPQFPRNSEVVRFVRAGGTHQVPSFCPPSFGQLMTSCLSLLPNLRPTFSQLFVEFDREVGEQELQEPVEETRSYLTDAANDSEEERVDYEGISRH